MRETPNAPREGDAAPLRALLWSRHGAGLAAILLVAGAVRFAGLDWGLRHPVHTDERVYVENVVAMVEAGDLDHRFYTYPGLFFYLLAPGIALLGPERWHTPDAYLVSRGLVAAVATLNVGLAYVVGSRLVGRGAGLVAALLMAASPVDVRTCHQVRPDILLEGLGLVALLGFRRVGERLRGDALAGLVIGIATAIKFTGLLMVPFYLAVRLLAPGRRLAGMLVAGAVTIGVVIAATPYAVLHAARYQGGPGAQLDMYYQERAGDLALLASNLDFYRVQVERAIGPWGLPLLAIGTFLAVRRDWRAWLPRLLHPLVTVVVMSTPLLVFPRLILPAMGVVYLLAARPIAALGTRWPPLAAVLALVAVAHPLRGSVRYANLAARPGTMDRALDWLEARVPEGALILETRPEGADPGRFAGTMLGVDPARHELLAWTTEQDPRGLALLSREADLVVTGPGRPAWARGLRTVYEGHHLRAPGLWRVLEEPEEGPVILRFRVSDRRPQYAPVDLGRARLAASEARGTLSRLADGDPRTAWSTREAMSGDEWIEVGLPEPARVGSVEVLLPDPPSEHGPELELQLRSAAGELVPVWSADARPPLPDQVRARARGSRRPLGQRLVFEARETDIVRLLQTGVRAEAWTIAELRIFVREGDEEYRVRY